MHNIMLILRDIMSFMLILYVVLTTCLFSDKPGLLDLKGKAKFEAWSKKKGTSKDDAQKAYVAKVEGLIASVGLQ